MRARLGTNNASWTFSGMELRGRVLEASLFFTLQNGTLIDVIALLAFKAGLTFGLSALARWVLRPHWTPTAAPLREGRACSPLCFSSCVVHEVISEAALNTVQLIPLFCALNLFRG